MGSTLGDLPLHWLEAEKKDDKPAERLRGGGGSDSPPAAKRVKNLHPDEGLQKRWREAGHSTIADMLAAADDPKPSFSNMSGGPMCLTYHFKGSCKTDCKRAQSHKHAGADIINAVHEFMDRCKIARA